MITPMPSFDHIAAISTGSFRNRFAACMKVIGVDEIQLKVSIGIDCSLLPKATACPPAVPLVTFSAADYYQPFVRDIICTPPLDSASGFLRQQRLRSRLVDPAASAEVRALCGSKAVFDIVWRQDTLPNVCVSGRSLDVTPLSDFMSGGTAFTVEVVEPREDAPEATSSPYEWDYELAVRLAIDHCRTRLPEECHNAVIMKRAFDPDAHTEEYLRRFDGCP